MGRYQASTAFFRVNVGVTEQQWRVLRVLQEEGPQEPTLIAERACLLLPSLTRILKKLEDKNLILRRIDLNDSRRQIVEISEEGLAIIHAKLPAMVQQAERTRTLLVLCYPSFDRNRFFRRFTPV